MRVSPCLGVTRFSIHQSGCAFVSVGVISSLSCKHHFSICIRYIASWAQNDEGVCLWRDHLTVAEPNGNSTKTWYCHMWQSSRPEWHVSHWRQNTSFKTECDRICKRSWPGHPYPFSPELPSLCVLRVFLCNSLRNRVKLRSYGGLPRAHLI